MSSLNDSTLAQRIRQLHLRRVNTIKKTRKTMADLLFILGFPVLLKIDCNRHYQPIISGESQWWCYLVGTIGAEFSSTKTTRTLFTNSHGSFISHTQTQLFVIVYFYYQIIIKKNKEITKMATTYNFKLRYTGEVAQVGTRQNYKFTIRLYMYEK